MPKQELVDQVYMNMAKEYAKQSKDPRTQVGAMLVHKNGRMFSFGYNGFAKGVPDHEDIWKSKDKYEFVIHAEENTLLNCPWDIEGATLYVTHRPCHKCISRVVNSGVARVVVGQDKVSEDAKCEWVYQTVVQSKNAPKIDFLS